MFTRGDRDDPEPPGDDSDTSSACTSDEGLDAADEETPTTEPVELLEKFDDVAQGAEGPKIAHPLPIALACIQWTSVTTAWMMRSFSSSRIPEMSAVALDPLFCLAAKALSLLSTASTRSSSGVLASSACRSALVYVSTDPGSMTRMAVAPVLDPESVCVSLRTCCNASHASRTVGAPVGISGPPPPLH